jgi:general secretion pathway protein L
MTETLLLRLHLPSADERVEACLWTPSRAAGGAAGLARSLGHLTLGEAASHAVGRRVVGVLPAAEVLAVDLALPAAAPAKLRASLPFALEEQIAGDIEAQQCAIGLRAQDGRWPVRVIARDRLEVWLALLRGAGLEPQSLVSAADGLREKPGDLMLWIEGTDAHWRAPGASPTSLPVDGDWQDGLRAALGDRPGGTLGLVVHALEQDAAQHADDVARLRGDVAQLQWILLPDGALTAFASQYGEAVNLLQGEHAPRRVGGGSGRSAWRWPLRLAAAVVLLQILGLALEAWRLHRSAAALAPALMAAARPMQPAVRDPDAALAVLRDNLARWSRTAGDPATAPLLAPLLQITQAKRGASSLQLESLSTEADGRLRVALSAVDGADLAAAGRALAADGWTPVAPDTTGATPAEPAAFAAVWRSPAPATRQSPGPSGDPDA